jgi:hypothetical protein
LDFVFQLYPTFNPDIHAFPTLLPLRPNRISKRGLPEVRLPDALHLPNQHAHPAEPALGQEQRKSYLQQEKSVPEVCRLLVFD